MLDAVERMPLIALGELRLPAESFAIAAAVGERTLRFCDGTERVVLLGEKAVRLELRGRLSAEDAGALPAKLLSALRTHERFSFPLCGCECTDMQLAAAECAVKDGGRVALYTLKMYGKITEVPEHDDETDPAGCT